LLTDINLPDMSGVELARCIVRVHAQIKVIFASGDPVVAEDVQDFAWLALRKPYTVDQLQHAIVGVPFASRR
jgi:two-component SAPR family response regulator